MGIVLMAVIVFIALIGIAAVVYATGIYNDLIMVKNNIDKAWANIDVLLKQRHDELPKLIETCKGYMAHEAGTLEKVIKARQAAIAANGPAASGKAEGELQGALRQLFALSESYPDLKAQSSFAQLQSRISEIENQIADRREFYNDSVNTYNIRIVSIPDLFVARFLGYTAREMFKVAEADKEDVQVKFS